MIALVAGGAFLLGGVIMLAYSEGGWSLFSQEPLEALAHGLGVACIGLGVYVFSRLRRLEFADWDATHPPAAVDDAPEETPHS